MIGFEYFLKPSNDDVYLGYVTNGFPRIFDVLPMQAMLLSHDGSVTQECTCYLKINGGVYLSIPKELKSDYFNFVSINGLTIGDFS